MALELDLMMGLLTSDIFKDAMRGLINRVRGKPPEEVAKEIDEFGKNTLDKLAEQQAEAITLEHLYLGLLEGRITEEQVTRDLDALGYQVNPSPLTWLRKKLTELRQWIVDAVKWLRMVGESLLLAVKEIYIEVGVTPKVSITFTLRASAQSS